MAKKNSKKENSSTSEKKKIEWNPDDGLDWRDFLGIFILIFSFFWKLFRLIFAPVFWIYGENIRMVKFARATGHERTLTEDERWFVETVPALYTFTGLVGGIIVGVFAALEFQEDIRAFFEALSVEFLETVFNAIGSFFGFIFDAIVWLITGIAEIISSIVEALVQLFQINPFLALVGLLLLGMVVMVVYISVMETGFVNSFVAIGRKIVYWLVGSPERFRLRVNSFYRRLNHRLTVVLVGKERLHTRTQIYFKRVVFYSFFLSIWSLMSGIFIGVDYSSDFTSRWSQVIFVATVLLFAGVISGTLFFGFVARLLDFWSRKKYISPQFISEEVVDQEAIDKHIEEDEKRIAEALRIPEEIKENVAVDEEEVKEEKAKSKSK